MDLSKYLNLGCGSRYHPDWTNVDFIAADPGVISCNLRKGIPFADATFDAVYHSHLLEHFTRDEAKDFICECRRVLKCDGVIRVVVPDLESIARTYLVTLDSVRSGILESEADYSWMVIELLDQVVRNKSGGLMFSYLQKENISNVDFVLKRCGIEAKNIINNKQNYNQLTGSVEPTFLEKIKVLIRAIKHPGIIRNNLIKLLLGKEYYLYEIARFRNSGEVHQWMYDDYSLKRLLEEKGFNSIVRTTAIESYIKGWSNYNLDTESDGTVYKPDSLYMEAIAEK